MEFIGREEFHQKLLMVKASPKFFKKYSKNLEEQTIFKNAWLSYKKSNITGHKSRSELPLVNV